MMSSIHFNKIFLVLAVALTFSAIGNALICNVCSYTSAHPKAQQVCSSNSTSANCSSGYCYSTSYTQSDGTMVVVRNCDDPNDRACPDAEDTCEKRTKTFSLKSCAGMCCNTDKCNNYTPDSATGFMAAKFTLGVIVILGLLLA